MSHRNGIDRTGDGGEFATPFRPRLYRDVIAYLSGHQTRVTDPAGAQVLTTTRGFGTPDQSEVLQVVDAMGGQVNTTRDIYGNATQMIQSGNYNGYNSSVTRQFWYNNELRLCRHRAPEFGPNSDEVFLYDAEGAITQSGRGAAAATGCVGTIPAGVRVARSYDALHRETALSFPSGTFALNRAYDANGNVTSASRGSGATWTYQYTALNAIAQEKLLIDGRTYQFDYGYSPEGSLSTRAGPGGFVAFSPDALGRARGVTVGAASYLNSLSYHPNSLWATAAADEPDLERAPEAVGRHRRQDRRDRAQSDLYV